MYPIHKYNLCRLCLFVGDQLMNIFEENETIDFIAEEAIEDLLQFKVVKETGFPWLVCASCLGKLTDFRLFKRRCIECKVTFEQRYQNSEEEDVLEIKPEEMQIKEETVEDCNEDAEGEDEEIEEYSEEGRQGGSEDYTADHHSGSQLECETGDDFVKTEKDEGGREVGSDENTSIDDMVEIKVEEVRFKDDPGIVTIDNPITVGKAEVSPRRNRLTVCDGTVDFGSSECVTNVEGGREEFMCAICEEIFLNLESLRSHLPCRTRTGVAIVRGGVSRNISSDFGGRTMDWEESGGDGGENFVSSCIKMESGVQKGLRNTNLSEVSASESMLENIPGKKSGSAAKKGLGRKMGVARPRNQRSEVRIVGKPSESGISGNFGGDKTVSYQCDMCHHGFSKLDKLKKHIQSHSEEGGYACPTCRKSFRTRWSLKNHRKSHQRVTQFECPICSRKFSRQQHLDVHKATHGTGTEYQCHICRKTFPQSSYLEMHLRAHEEDESTQCHICGKRFSQKNVLTVHLRVHMGIKPFECQICHKRFSQKNNLKNHILSHEDVKPYSSDPGHLNQHFRSNSGNPPFQCHLCGKVYEQDQSLRAHLENHPAPAEFGPNLNLPSQSGVGIVRSNAPPLPREHSSNPDLSHVPVSIMRVTENPVSQEQIDAGRGYMGHAGVETLLPDTELYSEMEPDLSVDPLAGAVDNTRARVANLGSPNSDEETDMTLDVEQTAETTMASEVSPHEGGSVDHLETISKVRPYRCHICHKCFNHKGDLISHQKIHIRPKPHPCEVCGKRFTEGVNLRKHMLVHMDGKPFDCPFCAKSFTLRKNFKRHLELDSCLKRLDFNTSECISTVDDTTQNNTTDSGNTFRNQNDSAPVNPSDGRLEHNFSDMSDNNPGNSMNKTLEDIMAAAKEASVEVYLEQEGSVSRVFPCTFCEKTFLRTDQLKKHLMVHGGIKPHACTLCSRRFTEKGNLSKHMKTHAYEKPYPCGLCEKAYTQKKNLERHMLSHKSNQATG